MPLAQLLQPPFTSSSDFEEWAFNHNDLHKNIVQAFAKRGTQLTYYPLWPVYHDLNTWQRWHQQMHLDMTAAAHTQQADMGDVSFQAGNRKSEDFAIWNNYMEHLWVQGLLNIA